MPGASCAIVGCGACNGRHKGLSFFRIKKPKNPEWERALILAVNRSDESFNVKNATICSRHFKPECIKKGVGKMCTLLPGSLPTEWMPQKSIPASKAPARKPPTIREPPQLPERVVYYSFADVRKAASQIQAPWHLVINTENKLVFVLYQDNDTTAISVYISPELLATVQVMGLPVHQFTSSIESVHLKLFLGRLNSLYICPGVTDPALQDFAKLPNGNDLFYRYISYKSVDRSIKHTSTVRSNYCQLLTQTLGVCRDCEIIKQSLLRKQSLINSSQTKPIHKNNSLNHVAKKKLKAAFKVARKHEAQLLKEINKFKQFVNSDGVNVGLSLHQSMMSAIEDNNIQNESELTKLFWKEQKKGFQAGKNGMRWHPMMIRLAILLHSRSPAAYATLRKTGILRLPGESTLREYTNVNHPRVGFRKDILDEITRTTKDYKDHERYIVLLHDEMSIKSDLVFDRRSCELIGFISSDQGGQTKLATHALLFFVVGINTNLSTSLGFFGTQTATADVLYSLFWEAVGLLETVCHLKVIASTSDKASPNQRLYDIHNNGSDICYKTRNIFALEREIFFFSDVPHLIKTVRNNLSSSGMGKNTRCLWFNGQHLLWKHVVDLYNKDCEQVLRRTFLTAEHVHLTPQSVMNVKLAAQVLSARVGKVMAEIGGLECQETAKFILLMDRFFDCLNTRSLTEARNRNKPDLAPYRDVQDERFTFLEDFQRFLALWRDSVMNRPGSFSQNERNKMFLSHQTYRGLCMTLKAFPEVTQYLLNHGVQYIFSNRFCQDPIEEHFGKQRSIGRRSENPNLWTFGYNETKLSLQRSLSLMIQPKGNVSIKRKPEVKISTSPLKKRKTQHH